MPDEKTAVQARCVSSSTGSNAVYGLGFIGALVYYMQAADSFLMVLFGILKAILWPAFLLHKLLGFLGM